MLIEAINFLFRYMKILSENSKLSISSDFFVLNIIINQF